MVKKIVRLFAHVDGYFCRKRRYKRTRQISLAALRSHDGQHVGGKFSYSVRVFIALTGTMALCWYQDEMGLLIPLFLGIIASALAETDDSWQGRLNALAVTLVCFMVAALSVELLFPYPILFSIAFALAAFCLTMLGALGERYGTIASATLILSVYTP